MKYCILWLSVVGFALGISPTQLDNAGMHPIDDNSYAPHKKNSTLLFKYSALHSPLAPRFSSATHQASQVPNAVHASQNPKQAHLEYQLQAFDYDSFTKASGTTHSLYYYSQHKVSIPNLYAHWAVHEQITLTGSAGANHFVSGGAEYFIQNKQKSRLRSGSTIGWGYLDKGFESPSLHNSRHALQAMLYGALDIYPDYGDYVYTALGVEQTLIGVSRYTNLMMGIHYTHPYAPNQKLFFSLQYFNTVLLKQNQQSLALQHSDPNFVMLRPGIQFAHANQPKWVKYFTGSVHLTILAENSSEWGAALATTIR
jgi:hypothetical protein